MVENSGGLDSSPVASAAGMDVRELGNLRRRVLGSLVEAFSHAAQVEVVGASQEGLAGMRLALSVDSCQLMGCR